MPVIHVVAALLVDADGRMCLVRKRGTESFMQPGGKPERGESAPQALVRELSEELGLGVDPAALQPLGRFEAVAANEPGHVLVADVFRLVTALRPGPHAEIDEVRWADARQADALGSRLAPLARRLIPLAAPGERASVRAAYDRAAGEYAAALPDAGFEAALERGLLDRFALELPPAARVLDAGCGSGRMLAHLHALRPDVVLTGLDLSPVMIDIARTAVPGADVVAGDLLALPFADGSFDAVLAWYSLIHCTGEALPAAFAELRRVLRPGGSLLVGCQAGVGSRPVRSLGITAHLHSLPVLEGSMRQAGLAPRARALRPPRPVERHAQAFVLAEAAAAAPPRGSGDPSRIRRSSATRPAVERADGASPGFS